MKRKTMNEDRRVWREASTMGDERIRQESHILRCRHVVASAGVTPKREKKMQRRKFEGVCERKGKGPYACQKRNKFGPSVGSCNWSTCRSTKDRTTCRNQR